MNINKYTIKTIKEAIKEGSSFDESDPVNKIIIEMHTCDFHSEPIPIYKYRKGTVIEEIPVQSDEKDEPWGFEYLNQYAKNYVIYVPEGIKSDFNFKKRTDEEYKLLVDLGLLKRYTGNLSNSSLLSPTEQDIMLLAKLISAEAGSNKLDELMVGSVVMNRVSSEKYPDTIYDVIFSHGQYACTWDVNFDKAIPTESEIDSAKKVISGEFAIPSNVLYQAGFSQGNSYLINPNPGGNTHYYDYPENENLSPIDRFGRPTLSYAQIQGSESINQNNIIKTNQKLYVHENFDVLQATSLLHKVATPGLLNQIGQSFADIKEQIFTFFNKIAGIFDDNSILNTPHNKYSVQITISNIKEIVYQAITFSNSLLYSTVDSKFNENTLMFLFMGKTSGFSSGTFSDSSSILTPGIGSVIKNFVSPTSSYYQIVQNWSGISNGITIASPSATIIQAIGDGIVTDIIESEDGYGKQLEITYNSVDGIIYKSIYGYLLNINVEIGDYVKSGEQVGLSGSNPISDIPQFYFQFYKNDINVNPLVYFYQSTYNSGAGLANIINPSTGKADLSLVQALNNAILEANQINNGSYDKWHTNTFLSPWQCTWWANGRADQYLETYGTKYREYPTEKGNGGEYYKINQENKYFSYGQAARANSIVSWSKPGDYGHVAYVEAVEADGSFWISHAGNGTSWFGIQHISADGDLKSIWHNSNYILNGFIYLDSPL